MTETKHTRYNRSEAGRARNRKYEKSRVGKDRSVGSPTWETRRRRELSAERERITNQLEVLSDDQQS